MTNSCDNAAVTPWRMESAPAMARPLRSSSNECPPERAERRIMERSFRLLLGETSVMMLSEISPSIRGACHAIVEHDRERVFDYAAGEGCKAPCHLHS